MTPEPKRQLFGPLELKSRPKLTHPYLRPA